MADQSAPEHKYVPPAGFVPTAEVAIKIAEAVWTPIYGPDVLKNKTVSARLDGEKWIIEGKMIKIHPGGVPVAEISKKTGEILRVSHGQ